MRISIIIIILTFSLASYGQRKKECGEKLDSKIINLNGQWKLVFCELYNYNTGIEKRNCPDHLLLIKKSKFYSKRYNDSIPKLTGTIKIKKDYPAKYGNCEVLMYFKTKRVDEVYAWDFDTYYKFWIVGKCDADSLVLYSPWTPDLIEKCCVVIRHYVRQK